MVHGVVAGSQAASTAAFKDPYNTASLRSQHMHSTLFCKHHQHHHL